MTIALMTDIHANREAFEACLAHAAERDIDQFVFLGDFVGYGADPQWVLDTLMEHVARGAIALLGNHDAAALGTLEGRLNTGAQQCIDWTRERLSSAQMDFLAQLPLTAEDGPCLYAHANGWDPAQFEYVLGTFEAGRSMRVASARITFCGHMHEPMLYHMGLTQRVEAFAPIPGSPIPLSAARRWLALPGSVGQPRDGNPAACYATFDELTSLLTYWRVPYDHEQAARKVLEAGLPPYLARVLLTGGHAVSSAPLAVGQRIDGFELLEHLHRGGMASLWRVARPDLERPAVMKVPAIQDDPTTIVGFEVEQMIMPLLSGPHVPRFIASGGFDAQPYIVMEAIEGASLRSRLDDSPLPAPEVAQIGAGIAEALHDLHHQHVIHLDVKPSNIMFRPNRQVVLIDYGLARHERLPDLLAEEFRLPLGTSPYISPEQVLHVRDDPRSDLFALGATLYHLATGQRAFGTPTSVAGLRKRLYKAPVPPRVINPDCPPWLQEIILHCLEVDPEQRYGSAAQVAFDLSQPSTVALTARADRTGGDSLTQQVRRWFGSVAATPVRRGVTQQLMRAPIVLAAVDLSQEWEALADALRATARRVLQIEPHARLACVSVLRTNRIALDDPTDQAGRNQHVQRLVQLQHWARPLALPPHRVTYHVLEAPDPAGAIIDYARVNRVDHIVIGCRGLSGLRRYLGGVSTRVVVEAPCSVTVVKVAREEALGAAVSA